MHNFQPHKKLVQDYCHAFEQAEKPGEVLTSFTTPDYHWRGMHPFYEQNGASDVMANFWHPLLKAFPHLHRREDIFFAGSCRAENKSATEDAIWTCSMGHFAGLFDNNWLGIRSTGNLTMIPYAEFHRIENDKIAETALFIDIIKVMAQANQYPLPPQTGANLIHPGPRTHDGILLEAQDPDQGAATLALTEAMITDLDELNRSGNDNCPPDHLRKTWHENMLWFGPAGIGATYTIERYQQQHQHPFRKNLGDKVFNGHVARIAEGNFAGWFGWPNLNNTNRGGFLGMPGNQLSAEMRVVDIYRREDDKLIENWIFIDVLHYLYTQGLDVLKRMRTINQTSE